MRHITVTTRIDLAPYGQPINGWTTYPLIHIPQPEDDDR